MIEDLRSKEADDIKREEFYFDEINSTQDYAKKLYLENHDNFIIYADSQTKGRGRNGRVWKAPSRGLWFSFDMDFLDKCELFTMAIGVLVREVLEEIYNLKVQLKWPNDLILDRKKVGGIICEKVKNKVIVGVGINTNIDKIEEEKATTFFNKTGKLVDNYEVMNYIISRCEDVSKLDKNIIIERFRKNMAYRGEICYVSVINENVKIVDVSDTGGLIVETSNGIKEVFAGEINVCI